MSTENGDTPPLAVGADGVVRLPAPLRAKRLRIEILGAAFAPGTPGVTRQRRAVGIAELRGAGVPRVAVPRRGALSGECEAFSVAVGGASVRLRVAGTIEDFDAGRPLRASGCGTLALPAGPARVDAEPDLFTPYLLRLRSPAASRPAALPGRVLDAGTATRGGREGVRLDLGAPARLVLAESFNRGRRANCDGRDLGEPEVGALFGTAWRVPADCREVEIAFAPNRLVNVGYAISLVVAVILLAVVSLGGVARRRARRRREGAARGDAAAASGGRGGRCAGARPVATRRRQAARPAMTLRRRQRARPAATGGGVGGRGRR